MSLKNCKLIPLPKISDERGNLTFIENLIPIPFDIMRVYYLYDIPINAKRGAHGHKDLEQIMIAVSGSLNIELDDGITKRTYNLNSPSIGLFISKGIWREMSNFSPNTVCLVLASEPYIEDDYIRNYEDFIRLKKRQ